MRTDMKFTVNLFAAVTLLLTLLSAKSAVAQLNFTVGSVTCSVGQDIEIPVSVNSISGANQLSFNMPYASDLMYLSEVVTSGTITSGSTVSVNALANGKTASLRPLTEQVPCRVQA